LPAQEFCTDSTDERAYVRHRALGADKAFLQKSEFIFNSAEKMRFFVYACDQANHRNFAAFFRCQLPLNFLHPKYLWLATPWL
jgi:hypothetical protein